MCLAVPGKIVEIKNKTALVDYGNEKRQGKILEGNYKENDFVILQGGIVTMKIAEKEAKESLKLYHEALNS